MSKHLLIGVVGPCAAGKSTLIKNLEKFGIQAKHIAQEHSYVQEMWLKISKPDILIYLNVSYDRSIVRRKQYWTLEDYNQQVTRLKHAREKATIYIDTDDLTIDEVLQSALTGLGMNQGDNSLVGQTK